MVLGAASSKSEETGVGEKLRLKRRGVLLAQLEKDLQPGGANKWRGRFILRAQEGWLLDAFHLEYPSKSPTDRLATSPQCLYQPLSASLALDLKPQARRNSPPTAGTNDCFAHAPSGKLGDR